MHKQDVEGVGFMGRPLTTRIKQSRWTPDLPPEQVDDLPTYLFAQLSELSLTMFNMDKLHLDRTYVLPNKPLDGDIMLFAGNIDGVGVSAGLYYYNGTEWIFIA